MWFKALRSYQARSAQDWSSDTLEVALSKKPFRSCHSQEEMSAGWVSPTRTQALLFSQGVHHLAQLKIEEKILPAAVVQEQLQEQLQAIKETEGRKVGRKERQNLADELRLELLPRAFTRSRKIWVWLDTQNHRILLDATTDKHCELALNLLREGLGSLPVVPQTTPLPVTQVMTHWLAQGPPPDLFLQEACELRDPEEDTAVVRIKGQALEGDEIKQHLQAGKRAVQLRLGWQEQVSFTLTDAFILKNLKFADELLEDAEDKNPDQDPLQALGAEFTLMSQTLTELVNRLLALHEPTTQN